MTFALHSKHARAAAIRMTLSHIYITFYALFT
jgi:hypothetical protein